MRSSVRRPGVAFAGSVATAFAFFGKACAPVLSCLHPADCTGPNHPETLVTKGNLAEAQIMTDQGELLKAGPPSAPRGARAERGRTDLLRLEHGGTLTNPCGQVCSAKTGTDLLRLEPGRGLWRRWRLRVLLRSRLRAWILEAPGRRVLTTHRSCPLASAVLRDLTK